MMRLMRARWTMPFCELRSAFHRNAACVKLHGAIYNFLMTLLPEGELSAGIVSETRLPFRRGGKTALPRLPRRGNPAGILLFVYSRRFANAVGRCDDLARFRSIAPQRISLPKAVTISPLFRWPLFTSRILFPTSHFPFRSFAPPREFLFRARCF